MWYHWITNQITVGQRSSPRSRHGTIGKVLSQRTHMPNIKVLPIIVQKLWPRLKFLWQTDRRTNSNRRMRFNVPMLSRKRGTIIHIGFCCTCNENSTITLVVGISYVFRCKMWWIVNFKSKTFETICSYAYNVYHDEKFGFKIHVFIIAYISLI